MERTRVYYADLSPLKEEKLLFRAYRLVPKERRERVDRLRRVEDRQRSLAAWLLLDKMLDDCGVSDRKVRYGEFGKPYTSGICWNLSHSGERILCVASEREVGCDVERIKTLDLRIAERFFHALEYDELLQVSSPEAQRALFYRMWTAKESYMKALGRGLSLPMNSFRVGLDPVGCMRLMQSEKEQQYFFREYDLGADYSCTVCAQTSFFQDAEECFLESRL